MMGLPTGCEDFSLWAMSLARFLCARVPERASRFIVSGGSRHRVFKFQDVEAVSHMLPEGRFAAVMFGLSGWLPRRDCLKDK